MTDSSVLPLVFVFGIISFMLLKSREVNPWAALFLYLFGVYSAMTPMVFIVVGLVQWFLNLF